MTMQFMGLEFELDGSWRDITETPESVPTLAREDGVGAFQFTVARYSGGERPTLGPGDLRDIMRERLDGLGLHGTLMDLADAVTMTCECVAECDEPIVLWFISDGDSIALVTYCATMTAGTAAEITQVREAVRTMRFV